MPLPVLPRSGTRRCSLGYGCGGCVSSDPGRATSLRDAARSGFQPYRAPAWASKRRADDGIGSVSHEGGNWNVLYLELHNIDFSTNRERCPVTSALMSKIPRAYGHAFFSAMAPGTHITPHHGPTNKSCCHLLLVVPSAIDARQGADLPSEAGTRVTGNGCRLCVGDDYAEPVRENATFLMTRCATKHSIRIQTVHESS